MKHRRSICYQVCAASLPHIIENLQNKVICSFKAETLSGVDLQDRTKREKRSVGAVLNGLRSQGGNKFSKDVNQKAD